MRRKIKLTQIDEAVMLAITSDKLIPVHNAQVNEEHQCMMVDKLSNEGKTDIRITDICVKAHILTVYDYILDHQAYRYVEQIAHDTRGIGHTIGTYQLKKVDGRYLLQDCYIKPSSNVDSGFEDELNRLLEKYFNL